MPTSDEYKLKQAQVEADRALGEEYRLEEEAEEKTKKRGWGCGHVFTEFLAKRVMRRFLSGIVAPRPYPEKPMLRKLQKIGDAMVAHEHPRHWRVNRPYYSTAFNFIIKLAMRDRAWESRLACIIWAIQNTDMGLEPHHEEWAKCYFSRTTTKKEWEGTSRERHPKVEQEARVRT